GHCVVTPVIIITGFLTSLFFSPFSGSVQRRSVCDWQIAITDLFITTARTAVLTSIRSPSLEGSSGAMRRLKMILIYTHNSADDNGGKYQKVNTSANAICKYVTGFSFIAGFASVTSGCHNMPTEKCF
uniref:hypothetical protein n=1 Tax=Klebsiella quasipneumoniae TaxID=1463165 RepID=UPI001CFBBBC6